MLTLESGRQSVFPGLPGKCNWPRRGRSRSVGLRPVSTQLINTSMKGHWSNTLTQPFTKHPNPMKQKGRRNLSLTDQSPPTPWSTPRPVPLHSRRSLHHLTGNPAAKCFPIWFWLYTWFWSSVLRRQMYQSLLTFAQFRSKVRRAYSRQPAVQHCLWGRVTRDDLRWQVASWPISFRKWSSHRFFL